MYKEAISSSTKYNFPQEEGLACERAAIFCIEQNQTEIASSFLAQSYNSYSKWGAVAKLNQMKKIYKSHLNESACSALNDVGNAANMQLEGCSSDAVSTLTTSTCRSFCLPRESKRRRTSDQE